jgi:hypothetical protein
MHWYHHLGAHIAQQRGVSGNEDVGCASIFVAGKREVGLGTDAFHTLKYAASTSNGALAMAKNCEENRPIRVFRSSAYVSRFRALGKKSRTRRTCIGTMVFTLSAAVKRVVSTSSS